MMMTLAVAALFVAAFLGWNLFRRFGADRLESFSDHRRPTSMLVARWQSMLPAGAVHAAAPPPAAVVPEVASAT